MEEFISLVKEANKAFETADHLAYVTYPIVNDIKLIALVAENLNTALTKTMEALLYYDKLYKRIQFIPNDFYSKFELFKTRSAKYYNLSHQNIEIILEIKEFIEERKKSQMEFSRKNSFVLYSNLQVKTMSLDKIKKYITQTKGIIFVLNQVLKQFQNRFNHVNT
ncbi:hypothetical protein HYT57_04705 [Candidatus Woesearchaeota archaeon]|nr:hypothetical protein [Candidatus Woesearchaeota archaeon]